MSHISNNNTRTKPFWRTNPRRLLPAAALDAAVSLPGFRDLAAIVDSLIDILKHSSTERDRCAALEFRIRSTARLVEDMPRLRQQDVHDFTTEFRAIQALFDDASCQGHRSYRKAAVKLEMLEELDRRLDNVADLIKMRMQLRDLVTSEDSRLKEVNAHDIVDQKIIAHPSQRWLDWGIESSEEQLVVQTSKRSGRIGNMPVMYVAYSSAQSPGEAEARAREDLMLMSQILHPNVATIVGVTKGPWLNGIVYSSAMLPLREFLRCTHDVTVLVSCLHDILATIHDLRRDWLYALCDEIHVDYRGRAVVRPTRDPRFGARYIASIVLSLFQNLDPILGDLVGIYMENLIARIPRLLATLNRLLHATGPMTMLTLHRTLHEMQVEPLETNERWEGTSLPPFTLLVGQVGVIQKSLSGNWLSLCPSVSTNDMPTLTVTKDVKPEFIDLTASIARVNGWLTYELPSSSIYDVYWVSKIPFSPVVWQDVVKQWTRRPTPLTEQVELESISLCRWICSIIYVERKIDLSDHNRVYYHRCPAARSDPRSFWGYFSTSKDPQAWSNNLENKGWKLRYRINTYMWKIVDDWGYKYRKLLAEGLRSMPGSFPTEAVETDLDEE